MTSPETLAWHDANQRYLTAALGAVREALDRHAGQDDAATERPPRRESDAGMVEPPPALETLCAAFGLSAFERAVLLACAGVELDSTFAGRCAAAQGDARRTCPTFGLVLAALPEAHWSALSPASALRRWRLVEVGAGETLTTSPLRISERVLHYLTGVQHLDGSLEGFLAPVRLPVELPPSQRTHVERIVDLWSDDQIPSAIQLCGGEGSSREAVAAAACASLGLGLYAMRAEDIPAAPAEREALARLWEREAVLSRSALLLDHDRTEGAESIRGATAFAEETQGMIFVSARDPVRSSRRRFVRLDVRGPSAAEQRSLWRGVLGPSAGDLNGKLGEITAQFSLDPQTIRAAGAEALDALSRRPEGELGSFLWEACRSQARSRLDDLAQHIESAAAWEDLILPDLQKSVLREVLANVRQRARVYDAWGFAGKGSRGLGISALFVGSSGTGKTMAAEVLAGELHLDLYRIDLSQVVSKYIGETEKNLRRVFDAAEEGGAVLLFDEADALFGKRSEVKDSHDRYANIEVSYLLQRMESYRGLAILTTNMKGELDPAFLRRLRFIVRFPFPSTAGRARIWERIFPPETPTDGLDVRKLARLNVAGGNIRNIAVQAAFLAADEGGPVRMNHLLRAAYTECAKLERPLTEAEIGGWV
ncbi:MAG TPA: ATP-binding protein [Rubrobacteraceae bacterium]|nr:ATP-binding protein [Rubrobacteraceae bacterium]